MKPGLKTTVLPKRRKLQGSERSWEKELERAGWDELPQNKQAGVITDLYEVKRWGAIVCDIYWPGANCQTECVFPDEVQPTPDMNDKYEKLRAMGLIS